MREDRIRIEALPAGDLVLEPDNSTTFIQHHYDGGLIAGFPRAELSEAARAEAPDGAVVSYTKVATPRVGVDGLREALKRKYGVRQGPGAEPTL